MRNLLPFIFLTVVASVSLAVGETLIPLGADWKYLDDGSDQGTNWVNIGFDDSSWTNGPAELGYGDGDEATVISFGGDENDVHITYYFRHAFVVTNAASLSALILDLYRDDGAVVYVNGLEVGRNNMPGGAVNYLTEAVDALGSSTEGIVVPMVVDGSRILNGTNVVAVEVHQAGPTSSDVSFDLSLATAPPEVFIPMSGLWRYLDDGSDQGTAWQAPSFDHTSWSNGYAQLGYGDGDEATVLDYGGVSTAKYITYYFRKTFVLNDPTNYPGMKMQLIRDDGAVIYINSNEVWRSNMPGGAVDYLTEASVAESTSIENDLHEKSIASAGLLVAGTNVVAIEIHQERPSSSDISLNFSLQGLAEDPVTGLVRGPYLQLGTPTSVVVRWRTEVPLESVVKYGALPGALTQMVSSASLTTEHEVVLSGLMPATPYYYSIGYETNVLAGGDSNYTFRTLVPRGVREPVRVWILGDSGTANANARSVRDAYYSWSTNRIPDVWLMLGDNAYEDGYDYEYQAAVFEMYTNTLHRTVLWPTLGNHDGHSASSALQNGPYYDIFTLPRSAEAGGLASGTEAYYSFDYANIHFICLESYETDRSTNGAMLTWMKNDAAATTQDWVIAFWHHPPYSKGSHNSDIDGRMSDMRENVLPMLEEAGVDLVLGGHSHAYERSFLINGHYDTSDTLDPGMLANSGSGREGDIKGVYDKTLTNGTVYAVAGSSGKISGGLLNHPAMYLSLNKLGSMVLDINGDQLDAHFINSMSGVEDWFTLRKHSALFTLETDFVGNGIVIPATSNYVSNAVVSVTAIPSNFYYLANWSGDLSGNTNPAMIVMDRSKSVTGLFEAITVTNEVPQWWLFDYGLGTNDADALDDQDIDFVKTWQEYVADTVPTSPASFLHIESINVTGAYSGVRFMSSSSRVYGVERAGVMTDTSTWHSVTSDVAGAGAMMTIQDESGGTTAVYRINVRLP